MSGEAVKVLKPFSPNIMPSANIVWTKSNKEPELTIKPSNVIIVEGIHAFQSEKLNNMAKLRVYIDCDYDNLLMWKIMRSPWWKKKMGKEPEDPRNFGQDEASAFEGWVKRSKPILKKNIEPQRKNANVIYTNNSQKDLLVNAENIRKLANLYFQNKEEFQNQLVQEKAKQNNSLEPRKTKPEEENPIRERERENIWKQPALYWGLGGGLLIAGLGIGIYYLIKSKENPR